MSSVSYSASTVLTRLTPIWDRPDEINQSFWFLCNQLAQEGRTFAALIQPTVRGKAAPAVWEKDSQTQLLNEISTLEEGWDGYGAPAISEQAVSNAKKMLDQLEQRDVLPTSIVPTTSGTIAFEWTLPIGGAYLEIGISTFGFYTSPQVGESFMRGGRVDELDPGELAKVLETLKQSTFSDPLANRNMAVGF